MAIIYILIGALLVSAGGFMAIWYPARKARRVRKDEIIAEKQVEAGRQAFNRITDLKTVMADSTNGQVLEWFGRNDEWFFDWRLFLPGKFAEHWLALRGQCLRLAALKNRLDQTSDDLRQRSVAEQIQECQFRGMQMVETAIAEIYRDMKIPRIALKAPHEGE